MIDFITNFINNLSWFGIMGYSVMSFADRGMMAGMA